MPNRAPRFSTGTSFSIRENETAVTTVVAKDPDRGDTVTYSITGGADASLFAIDPATGVLRFLAAPDYEAPLDQGRNNVYDVTVTATDGQAAASQALQITVLDVADTTGNRAPVITSGGGGDSAQVSMPENSTAVTTVAAQDADPGTTLAFSITGGADAALFTIDARTGALSFRTAPDYELPTDSGQNNVYDVVVQVSDGSLTDQQAIAVTVTDVKETGSPSKTNAPVIRSDGGGDTASLIRDENTTAVTTVNATVQGKGTITYSISGGADAALFQIQPSTGVLTFVAAPDYERPTDADGNNIYEVTVQASDGSRTDTQALSVQVRDVAENAAPVITSSGGSDAASFSVAENTQAVTTITATDPDGDTPTFRLTGADAALFAISASGELSFLAAPDFENPADAGGDNLYEVTVVVEDGKGGSDQQALSITVTDAAENRAPVITSLAGAETANVSLAENTQTVTTVTVDDPDGDTPTFRLTGADAALFAISTTGELSFLAAPDFENPADAGGVNLYEVAVVVEDGKGGSDEQALSITVTDAAENRAPVITSLAGAETASLSVAENTQTVTTVTVDDPDGDTPTFRLTGADAALFAISTTGELSFLAAPDFENPADAGGDNIYEVAVVVEDGKGGSDEQALSVTVTDAAENRAPVITSLAGAETASLSVAENTQTVTTVTVDDPDGDTPTFRLTGADAALFAISTTGELSFLAAPDFENPADADGDNIYEVAVVVEDGKGGSDQQALSVTVTDAAENRAPVITSLAGAETASLSVAENTQTVTT
ncbi:cadherin repeat domain-containing protein, partial [Ramlibacter sp. AW1]